MRRAAVFAHFLRWLHGIFRFLACSLSSGIPPDDDDDDDEDDDDSDPEYEVSVPGGFTFACDFRSSAEGLVVQSHLRKLSTIAGRAVVRKEQVVGFRSDELPALAMWYILAERDAFGFSPNRGDATIRLFCALPLAFFAYIGERSGPPLSESGTKKRANYHFARQMRFICTCLTPMLSLQAAVSYQLQRRLQDKDETSKRQHNIVSTSSYCL